MRNNVYIKELKIDIELMAGSPDDAINAIKTRDTCKVQPCIANQNDRNFGGSAISMFFFFYIRNVKITLRHFVNTAFNGNSIQDTFVLKILWGVWHWSI